MALQQMADKGIIHRLPIKGEMHYCKMILAIGMFERQLNHLTPEFDKDIREYMNGAFGEAFHSKKTTQLRTVPVHQSIAVEHNVATYDDIREYVRRSDGPFAKMNCICRQGSDLHRESCKQTNLRENCLTLGMAAETMVGHGAARFISQAGDAATAGRGRPGGPRAATGEHQDAAVCVLLLRMLLRSVGIGQTVPSSRGLL